jgi:tetratricopeptide (TPR) repeat protein
MNAPVPEAAREHLGRAQALHTEGRIADALREANAAVRLAPEFAEAWMYLGTTLVTRMLRFQEGLDALEKAQTLAPDDDGLQYSLGWVYEFVAYRLSKQATKPYRDPEELFERAMEHLKRCIEITDDQGLREDAQDLLASIEARY